MAFPQPNAQRELANRKILEELQIKKHMLLKQGPTPPLTTGPISLTSTPTSTQLPLSSIPIVTAMTASFEDIEGKMVADLGAGCGVLSIGAGFLGAGHVVSYEIDNDAINIFHENVTDAELDNIDIIHCNVLDGFPNRLGFSFDTIIMNPPFGTKHNAGMDMMFLKRASEICHGAIYSLHKTSTRSHVIKRAKELNLQPKVLAELRYQLPSSYRFHKKASVDIEVDFWRFEAQVQLAALE